MVVHHLTPYALSLSNFVTWMEYVLPPLFAIIVLVDNTGFS